jgi:integrase
MGSVYRRRLRNGRLSTKWSIKYYVGGRPVREPTGTDKKGAAGRVLKEREGRVAAGLPMLPRVDRVLYEEAAEDLVTHYQTTGSRKLSEVEKRLKHLARFFTGRRLAALGGAEATGYVAQRQTHGAGNGTINRELAVLTKMLRLAFEHGKLLRLPIIRKLKEPPPRSGFFEREAFTTVRAALHPDLQVAATIAYAYGWRMQSEVLTLERRHVDLRAGTLRLDPGQTKNDDGRVAVLVPELKTTLTAQLERVEQLSRRLGRVVPWLFPHLRGRHRGQRIQDFRKAWESACAAAGVSGMLRHDLRRTAVRNMVNQGVPERVAMTVTGHRTRSVFDRYHIVSPADLEEVARRLTGTL